jgi:hypothetical protein
MSQREWMPGLSHGRDLGRWLTWFSSSRLCVLLCAFISDKDLSSEGLYPAAEGESLLLIEEKTGIMWAEETREFFSRR